MALKIKNKMNTKKNWQEQKIKLDDSIAVAHGSIESHILLVVQTKIRKADAGLLKDGFWIKYIFLQYTCPANCVRMKMNYRFSIAIVFFVSSALFCWLMHVLYFISSCKSFRNWFIRQLWENTFCWYLVKSANLGILHCLLSFAAAKLPFFRFF